MILIHKYYEFNYYQLPPHPSSLMLIHAISIIYALQKYKISLFSILIAIVIIKNVEIVHLVEDY